MNPEIWDKLTHQAKRRDLRVAAIQKTVTKVGAILTGSVSKIMATLADSKKSNITSDLEELLTFSTDAIPPLAHSNQNLSQHRHDLIRPSLNKEYSAMCSPHIPITGKLFGDELQSQLNSTPFQPEKEAVTSNCSLNGVLGQVDINNFVSIIPALKNYFTLRADCFKAGQLVDYVGNWKLITSDHKILSMVQGIHIDFQPIPFQKVPPSQCVKQSGMDVISTETENFYRKVSLSP